MKCSIVLFSLFISIGEGSRILVSAPFGPKSHHNMFVPLIKELSNKGHNITVLSNYESSELLNISNIRYITVHELAIDLKRLPNIFETILDPDYWELTKSAYNTFFYDMAESITMTFDHPGIRQLLSDPDEKFDLVLMSHAASLASLPMVWHFKAPMISMSPNILFPGTSTALGDDEHDSYAPFMLSSFTDRMTLSERTINFMINRAFIYFASRWHFATSRSYVKRTGLIPDCPPLEEIERNMSLVFINSHPAFSYPRALPPQVIEIGAMHCRKAKPLVSDLETFVNLSGDAGFIVFGAGTWLQLDDLPEEIIQSFIRTFARLPHRVIWQWKGKPRADLPKNVLALSWFPQQDLLGHKKCRLFITHGGLNSLQEAVFHRVPVLGLPIVADQSLNIKRAVRDGYALRLDWKDVTEESLTKALDQLLHNSSYFETVSRLSNLFRDQLKTPLERAVYWTEFVLRHNGAEHLRLGSRDQNFIQRNLVDVYLILILIGIIPLVLTLFCVWKICRQNGKTKFVSRKKTQ